MLHLIDDKIVWKIYGTLCNQMIMLVISGEGQVNSDRLFVNFKTKSFIRTPEKVNELHTFKRKPS